MSRIIMITGGQRSGKSEFAEQMALSLSPAPVYVATARVFDDDFRERVARHRARRGAEWLTVEQPLHLSEVEVPDGGVALIDCVTLWATNAFFEFGEDVDKSLAFLKREFELFTSHSDGTFVFVTNEVGLGGVSADAMQRHFADLQGAVNRLIAAAACDVYMIISGIPVKIK